MKRATIAFLAFLVLVSVVYAVTIIYSETITVNVVDVTPTVTIGRTPPSGDIVIGSDVTFSGTVMKGTQPVSGATVTLLKNGGDTGASTTTGTDGDYVIVWNTITVGTHNFQVRVDIL